MSLVERNVVAGLVDNDGAGFVDNDGAGFVDNDGAGFVDNDEHPVGHGRMLRKEDPRFVRGRGRYVDDITLPGMLHLAILRSPVAHARIVSIDTTAAEAHPKVKAVVTGARLATMNLAWMPTISNDVQAVLATDKVR